MRLHEEYITRHNINIPIIRYDSHSTVFLRSKFEPVAWKILDIRWESCYWHPGDFTFALLHPTPGQRRPRNAMHPFNVKWDEYETRLIGWLAGLKMEYRAVPVEESRLSIWYMFLMMYDAYLVNSRHLGFGTKFYQHMAASIDPSLPLKDKEKAARLGEQIMLECDSDLQMELHDLKFYIKSYADWLVRYING